VFKTELILGKENIGSCGMGEMNHERFWTFLSQVGSQRKWVLPVPKQINQPVCSSGNIQRKGYGDCFRT